MNSSEKLHVEMPLGYSLVLAGTYSVNVIRSDQVHMMSKNVLMDYCCAASVASKQHYKQDLRKIYRRGDEFSN